MGLQRSGLVGAWLLAAVAMAGSEGPPAAEGVTDVTNWNRRPPGAGDYQIVMEVSGRAEVARFLEIPPPGADLAAICSARKEAEASALSATRRYLDELEAVPAERRDLAAVAQAHEELGQLFSYEGRMPEAIAEMEAAYRIVSSDPPRDPAFVSVRGYLEAALGVLQLRRGELENCVHDHNAARCIFPIRGPGQHDQPSGSAAAVEYFQRHLRRNPGNLEVRWLLNVATMTLGRYPDAVPPDLLIPPSAFASKDDPGLFVDTAAAMGLDATRGEWWWTISTATGSSTWWSPASTRARRCATTTTRDRVRSRTAPRRRASPASSAGSTSSRPITTTTAGSTFS